MVAEAQLSNVTPHSLEAPDAGDARMRIAGKQLIVGSEHG
jgi:hypothetical protein